MINKLVEKTSIIKTISETILMITRSILNLSKVLEGHREVIEHHQKILDVLVSEHNLKLIKESALKTDDAQYTTKREEKPN